MVKEFKLGITAGSNLEIQNSTKILYFYKSLTNYMKEFPLFIFILLKAL